jgi:hypothetical protein
VADLVGAASVIFSKDALDAVTARATRKTRPDAGHANQDAGPDAPRSNKTEVA